MIFKKKLHFVVLLNLLFTADLYSQSICYQELCLGMDLNTVKNVLGKRGQNFKEIDFGSSENELITNYQVEQDTSLFFNVCNNSNEIQWLSKSIDNSYNGFVKHANTLIDLYDLINVGVNFENFISYKGKEYSNIDYYYESSSYPNLSLQLIQYSDSNYQIIFEDKLRDEVCAN